MSDQFSGYSEHDLVLSLAKYLVTEGYSYRLEVSNMGQSIDLVAYKNRWFSAIEVKRNDWKKAVEQCKAHRLVADYIIVAVAQRKVSQALSDIATERGLGVLLFCDGEWKWGVTPKYNDRKWKPQRKQFLNQLRGVPNVCTA